MTAIGLVLCVLGVIGINVFESPVDNYFGFMFLSGLLSLFTGLFVFLWRVMP